RAAKASARLFIGNWIKDQRTAIGNAIGTFNCDQLEQEMENEFLEAADQPAYLEVVFNGTELLKQQETVLPPMEEFEKQYYERWINANFRSFGHDHDTEVPGCIEYRIKPDDEGRVDEDSWTCTVETPEETAPKDSAKRVASALNKLFAALPVSL